MKKEIIVRRYSEDFKKMVVLQIENGEISIRGAQRKYNIAGSETINKWRTRYGTIPLIVKYHYTGIDKSGNVIVSGV